MLLQILVGNVYILQYTPKLQKSSIPHDAVFSPARYVYYYLIRYESFLWPQCYEMPLQHKLSTYAMA
jgi:hypothetical protein